MRPKIIVLSLGGSLIVPDAVDTGFLRMFRETIEKYIRKGYKFAVYCGGGRLARNFQNAASEISHLKNEELDWLGIYATRLNALLIRYIFGKNAQDPLIANPNEGIKFKKNILVAAGWIPGWSTDYDAVLLAKNLGVKEIINMSNIDYVYKKDPNKFKGTEKIENISWSKYANLISRKWVAGMNAPFDPVAARKAEMLGLKVFIIGKNLRNFENLLDGKAFKGTVIH
ncbi:MAG: UMP kinase [Nanoarchaeota archaeon]